MCASVYKLNRAILAIKKIIAVCFQICTKHIKYTVWADRISAES